MKRILLISLALVLALGTLGVASALWWDWLYIDGYVETGNVGAGLSVEGFYDDESADKDVSSVYAYLVGDKEMWIDIYNAYPSITYTVLWDIHCTGSVPIHFITPVILTTLPVGATLTFTGMDGAPIIWEDVQLHEGDTLYGMLTLHLDNDALQNETYSFGIYFEYGQYNEFPPPG